MTHLQKHLHGTRQNLYRGFKKTSQQVDDKPHNPYTLEGMSDALSSVLTITSSGICKMMKEKRRWPKLNTAVAIADFLDICPDMVFELARKDMKAEMQQRGTAR